MRSALLNLVKSSFFYYLRGRVSSIANSSDCSLLSFSGYKLMGIVSHIGTSTQCGHYVAHILKDGRWVIFNDNKVGASVNPPKDMGYLYFFERRSS